MNEPKICCKPKCSLKVGFRIQNKKNGAVIKEEGGEIAVKLGRK